MADQDDTLDPEPVDAEFEPADDSRPSGKRTRNNLFGAVSLIVIAGLAAGAVWLGMRPGPDDAGPGDAGTVAAAEAEAELAAQAELIDSLEARMVALESSAAAPDPGTARLDELEARLAEAEARPSGTADTSGLDARLTALEEASPAEAGDSAALDALADRLDRLEATAGRLEALANRALDTAQAAEAPGTDPQILQDFGDRLTALENAGPAEPSADAATADQIAALEQQLAALRAEIAETRQLAEGAQSAARSAEQTAEATAGRETGADASRQLAARALALTSLREIAATGESFEAERAALARQWRDNRDLAAMADYARAGVPTIDELAADYPGEAIRDAAGPGRVFFGLVELRQVEPGTDTTGPLAITGLAEQRLAEDDLAAAIALTEQLEGEALERARDWLIAARARLDLNTRLGRLRQALADSAAETGADPS